MTVAIQAALIDPNLKAILEAEVGVNALDAAGVASQADLDATEATVITDLGHLRTAIIACAVAIDLIGTKLNTLAAKLNSDAGVTDANYAIDFGTTLAANAGTPAAVTTA